MLKPMKLLAIALLGAAVATQTHRLPQPGVRARAIAAERRRRDARIRARDR